MLRELIIKNLAIIDDLSIEFERGLNILTGETGAGKSIIVDALGFALGDRAQTELVKTGRNEASVEAFFEVSGSPLLEKMDISADDGVILRRNISAAGKSRSYINGSMTNVQGLSAVGRALVDIHGQHEHQSLLSAENQRLVIDYYGKLSEDKTLLARIFGEVQHLKKELADLRLSMKERAQRLDVLRFQVAEIDAALPAKGEKESLEEEKAILSNLNRLNELIETAYGLLYSSDGSCAEKLSAVFSKVREMAAIDSSAAETLGILESALPMIEEASISLRHYKDKYNVDPGRLEAVEDRLEFLRKLEKKYGGTVDSVLRYRDDAQKELLCLELSDEKLAGLEADLLRKDAELNALCQRLSEKRKKSAEAVGREIRPVLKELAFENAFFEIDLKPAPLSSEGMDMVEFLFSANPGEEPKPLSKIASGGEISRIMLAIKSILAGEDKVPVLIFDEIDAGIGGKTAENVAVKLRHLARKHQVLCITHLPQIAGAADNHLLIEKGQTKNGVCVKVRKLSDAERREEIARMLSGKITDISLKHAGEILDRNNKLER